MPEVTLTSPVALKLNTKKGKPYLLVKQDGEETGYFSWDEVEARYTVAKQAEDNGLALTIVHDGDERFPSITELRGPVEGNGSGPKARETIHTSSGSDLLGKAVNTALMQAVATMTHTVKTDATPKEVSERVLPLAGAYLLWLKEQNGMQVTPEDIPF